MNDDLHRHLDGDLPLEGLGEDTRHEAEAWERLLAAFHTETTSVKAMPWLESAVMAEIEALPTPGAFQRTVAWLFRPQSVRVSPLMVGAAAAALATVLLVGGPGFSPGAPGSTLSGPQAVPAALDPGPGESVVLVQFALEAPGASSVAVAGDFDGWEGANVLSDPDGDGIWTGRIPVKPGVHMYMFLVDGSTWVTDPRADRYQEDGFGNRNAILAVTAPSA
ncbi:MAG: glycogen-binding domain-containing protein [Longimicrobiales bacterium]